MELPLEVRFIKLMARLLHEFGAAAHRLENAVSSVAGRLGLHCEVFSTPTSVFLTFRRLDDPEHASDIPIQLLRLHPGGIDIGKLCQVDQIALAVAAGELDLAQGAQQLAAVSSTPTSAPFAMHLLAWSVIGLAVATLLGSTWVDIAIAGGLGAFTGFAAIKWGHAFREFGSFEPIVAFVVTVLAYIAAGALGGSQVPNIVIGALIVLMPGLDLTVAITELSTGHLASGTARFAGAAVGLVKLALGVMLATQIMHALGATGMPSVDPAFFSPDWFTWVALLASGFAFCVLFNAQRRDYAAVVTSALVAFTTNYFASAAFGPDFGIFLAALAIAALSNAYGRIRNRPAVVMRLPGIILLVPGSLGYRAVTLLFSHNIGEGLDAAVAVGLVLAALVGGLLMGNTLVPPRRSL